MSDEIISSHDAYILNIVNNNMFGDIPQKYFLTEFDYVSTKKFSEIEIDNIKIYYKNSENDINELDKSRYKTFVVENKICIGILHISDYQKYSVTVEYENKKQDIQLYNFENIDKYLKMGRDHQWGAFMFLDSCPAVNALPIYDGGPTRCDLSNYGPHGWGASGSSSGEHSMNINDTSVSVLGLNFAEFDPIINIPKCGHICYIRMRDLTWGSNNLYGMEMPFVARTLPEMFKIIIEWAEVTESPWNNTQDIAIKAKKFIEALDIPEDVYNSMSQNQASMHTFMYLNGNENARMRPELDNVKNFEKIVVDWLKTKFTYLEFLNMINVN